MSLQKTEAIVLKSLKQGETSKILTLYTRRSGKMSVIAKGARGAKSRFGGSLEPCNYISIVYYQKESRDLQFLSQAEIVAAFPGIKRDLEKTTVASAVCEVINRFEVDTEANPRLFRLALYVLKAIDQTQAPALNIFRAFQIRLISLSGFSANFVACQNCGTHTDGSAVFSISGGGFYCRNCRSGETGGIMLSAESLSALRMFQKAQLSQLTVTLSPASEQQIDAFLEAYFRYHVEGFPELKSIKFLKRIREGQGAS